MIVRCLRPLAGILALLAGELPARAGEFQSSLTATVSLTDPDGAAIAKPGRGRPFRIEVALKDAATGAPPKGVFLQAWIRPATQTDTTCQDAARAFRATRSIADGSVDLNGIVLAQLNRDGSFGIVDPKLNLRSSNMLGATRFDTAPHGFAVDPRRQVAYFSFPDAGTVEAVSLVDGERRPFARSLRRPGDVAVAQNGTVWIAEDGAVAGLNALGERLASLPVDGGAIALVQAGDRILAFSAAGSAALLDAGTGRERIRLVDAGRIGAAAIAGDALILLDSEGREASIRFMDAPQSETRVPLAGKATGLAASRSGAHVFAFSEVDNVVSVIDVATAQVIQAFSAGSPIAEAAFTENAAYFMLADQSAVLALNPASIALGQAPALRRIAIGSKVAIDPKTGGASPMKGLLLALPPSQNALAIHADSTTGFILQEAMAIGDVPPMDSVRLRGGIPLAVKVADRSFRESAPGRFETHARLDRPGDHELVLTTGIAGMTLCFPIKVDGDAKSGEDRSRLALRLVPSGAVRAGQPQILRIDIVDSEGRSYSAESVELAIPSLSFNWTGRFTARRDGGGRMTATITLPRAGTYAVRLLTSGGTGPAIAPAVLEVGL